MPLEGNFPDWFSGLLVKLKIKVKLLVFILIIGYVYSIAYDHLFDGSQTSYLGRLLIKDYLQCFLGHKVKITLLVFISASSAHITWTICWIMITFPCAVVFSESGWFIVYTCLCNPCDFFAMGHTCFSNISCFFRTNIVLFWMKSDSWHVSF